MRQAEARAINECNQILDELKTRPLTIDLVQSLLTIKYWVAYKYMERLVDEGLIQAKPIYSGKHGGFKNRYTLTELGTRQRLTMGLDYSASFDALGKYWPLGTIIKTRRGKHINLMKD